MKKFLSILLCLALIVSAVPIVVYGDATLAADPDTGPFYVQPDSDIDDLCKYLQKEGDENSDIVKYKVVYDDDYEETGNMNEIAINYDLVTDDGNFAYFNHFGSDNKFTGARPSYGGMNSDKVEGAIYTRGGVGGTSEYDMEGAFGVVMPFDGYASVMAGIGGTTSAGTYIYGRVGFSGEATMLGDLGEMHDMEGNYATPYSFEQYTIPELIPKDTRVFFWGDGANTNRILLSQVILSKEAPEGVIPTPTPDPRSFLEYETVNGEVKITGFIGSPTFLDIPEEIDGLPVTSIGYAAFRNCSSLRKISLPNTLTTIEDWAFDNCESLSSIVVKSNVANIGSNIFYDCSNLKNLVISDNATDISSELLSSLPGVQNISLGDGITEIRDNMFSDFKSLTEITMSNNVTRIGKEAFSNCVGLRRVAMPSSVNSIGSRAFSGCRNLSRINMPDGITDIGESTFAGCLSLTGLVLPTGVKSIGDYAFSGCSGLLSINIPDGVTSIGTGAFSGCGKLGEISIPNGVTTINDETFSNCASLTNINIPSGVVSIGVKSFAGCTGLTEITIADSVTVINESAFSGCANIETIVLPKNLTAIRAYCFSDCEKLTTIHIPKSVTAIESFAFPNCIRLHDVYYEGSETEWQAINIGSYNEYLFGAVIHFAGTSPEVDTYTVSVASDIVGGTALLICEKPTPNFPSQGGVSETTVWTFGEDTSSIIAPGILDLGNGLSYFVTSDNSAYATGKEVGGVTFPNRIKLGGRSTFSESKLDRVFTFTPAIAGTVTVYFTHGSSSGDPRSAQVYQSGNLLGSKAADPGAQAVSDPIAVAAGAPVFIGGDNNIGVYGITFIPAEGVKSISGLKGGETIKVYAKADHVGDTVSITTVPSSEIKDLGGGYYEFTMPNANTTVNATFTSSSQAEPTLSPAQPTQFPANPPAQVEALVWDFAAAPFVVDGKVNTDLFPEGSHTNSAGEVDRYNITATSVKDVNGLSYVVKETGENNFQSSRRSYPAEAGQEAYEASWSIKTGGASADDNRYFTFTPPADGTFYIWARSGSSSSPTTVTATQNGATVGTKEYAANSDTETFSIMTFEVKGGAALRISESGNTQYYKLAYTPVGGGSVEPSTPTATPAEPAMTPGTPTQAPSNSTPGPGGFLEPEVGSAGLSEHIKVALEGENQDILTYYFEPVPGEATVPDTFGTDFMKLYHKEGNAPKLGEAAKSNAEMGRVMMRAGTMADFEIDLDNVLAVKVPYDSDLQIAAGLIGGTAGELVPLSINVQTGLGANNPTRTSLNYEADRNNETVIAQTYSANAGDIVYLWFDVSNGTFRSVTFLPRNNGGSTPPATPTPTVAPTATPTPTPVETPTTTPTTAPVQPTTAPATPAPATPTPGGETTPAPATPTPTPTTAPTPTPTTAPTPTPTPTTEPVILVGIRIMGYPKELEVIEGMPLNIDGLVVEAIYNNGTFEEINDYTLTGFNSAQLGSQTVTIEYNGFETTFPINVIPKSLTGLEITQKPNKRSYIQGEDLDTTGMVVTAIYNNGTSGEVKEYEVSGYDPNKVGTQIITVSYELNTIKKSAEFTVTVAESVTGEAVEAPKINISSFIGGKTVTLTCATKGAEIYYTLEDNTAPDKSSTWYDGPISITETTTIKAVAILGDKQSKTVSGRISVSQVGKPISSQTNGELKAGTIITLRSATSGAMIYYTTDDDSDPATNGTKYSGGIAITSDMTIKAIAVKDGYKSSDVVKYEYTVPEVKPGAASVSVGSATGKAGDNISVPIYLFTDDDTDITSYRFTVNYEADSFDYLSVTPAEGVKASNLFTSVDGNAITVIYKGDTPIENGEVCNINLLALASDKDGEYPVRVAKDNVKIGDKEYNVDIIDGKITLEGSANSKLESNVVLTDENGQDITDNSELTGDITANVTLENSGGQSEQEPTIVKIIMAVYDRNGCMIDISIMDADLSDLNYVFTNTVTIPPGVEVGDIKLMIWNGLSDMNPMTEASRLL